ncbi:MAG TPA: M56 family metallopeptidase [Thermoanaerobaculia bacterium]|jgi:beta-lactamase regulating signal transducer with metallopeptidase domain|nr:M56 family metallopeptidase [Thermoanaerobaculia bacterium]
MSALSALESLLRASLQGAVLVGLVWLVCRLFPRLPASVRCGLWWMACLKLLVGLVWLVPVRVPLLPAPTPAAMSAASPASPARIVLQGGPTSRSAVQIRPGQIAATEPGAPEPRGLADRGAPWILGLWLAGMAVIALRALHQLRHTRWVIRRSEAVGEGWIRGTYADLCLRLGLRRAPDLRGSADVRTPMAIGLLRPRVVVPRPGFERLSQPEATMTLCHELLHVRRHDLWFGWVPALAQRIFFFHPLAALAVREYAIAREAACDAEVLRVLGSAPQAYGRLLLRWGVAPRETGLAAAGASPSLENLKRRLQMLQQISDSRRRISGWWWVAGAVAVVSLIPIRIVAQEPEPAPVAVAAPETPEISEVPEPPGSTAPIPAVAPVVAVAPVAPVPGGTPVAMVAPVAGLPAPVARVAAAPAVPATPATPRGYRSAPPAPPAPPVPPAPPAPPPPPPHHKSGSSYSYSYSHHDNGEDYIMLRGDDSATMSGSTSDIDKVRKLRGSGGGDILWFRHAGKEYVVRDAATLKAAVDVFKEQQELGRKQGELGAQQGKLGARQGELGSKQGALGAKQGALGAELGAIAADRARRGSGDDRDLEKKEAEIDKKMRELGRQQEELGRQQEELGRQQEPLGRQQEELGRQQEAASRKAEKELKVLKEQAIRSGAAQEVH